MTAQPRWPAEHWTRLKRLIELDGMSATLAAIALNESFGAAYTRNSVISKANRTGIKMAPNKGGRSGPKGGPSQRKKRAKAVTPAQRPDLAIRAAQRPHVPGTPYVQLDNPLPPGTVELVDLAEDGCKWPSGDPALFCGRRRADGSPYCHHHHGLAYRVDQRR